MIEGHDPIIFSIHSGRRPCPPFLGVLVINFQAIYGGLEPEVERLTWIWNWKLLKNSSS